MKKVIIFSLMLISAFSVDAQRKRTRTATSQGNVAVRFGFGVNSTKVDPDLDPVDRSTTINFNPSVGYFVVDNLELGVKLDIDNSWGENVFAQSPAVSKTLTNATTVGFGVYAQKYFPLNNWFAFTTRGSIGLGTGSFTEDDVTGSITTPNKAASGNLNTVGAGIDVGFGFTPYNAFGIAANFAGIGIQNTKKDYNNANDAVNTTKFGFNVYRNPIDLSIVWYFGRGLWKK